MSCQLKSGTRARQTLEKRAERGVCENETRDIGMRVVRDGWGYDGTEN